MKTGQCDVFSGGKKVGVADYPIYDSTAEAVENLGEEKVLSLINAQVKTDERNKIRSEMTKEPSKEKYREMAMVSLKRDPETLQAAILDPDPDSLNRLIEAEIVRLKAEREATLAKRKAELEAEVEDEEAEDEDEN